MTRKATTPQGATGTAPGRGDRIKHGAGDRIPLIDGIEKVTGNAKYTADLDAGNALVGRILRSRWSHAEILGIDTSRAAALPGVEAVITGDDCDKPFGVLPIAENEFPLARGKVRYRGDPIAAVAAIDERTADQALRLIEVQVRELPEYTTAQEAREIDAVAIHEELPGNLLREQNFDLGETDDGFANANLVLEEHYVCPEINHMQMELNASLAVFDPYRKSLTIKTVTQVPYYLHLMLAQCLDLDPSRVRVIKPFVGGGFGARVEALNFEIITGLLARAVGGKVRLTQTREECFINHRGRQRQDIDIKIGLTKEGVITACDLKVLQAGGAYASYGIITLLYAGAAMAALYQLPALRYLGQRIVTNTPPCGAMRGHGCVDSRYAFESLFDEMAEQLTIDPFEIRRRNLFEVPYETVNGARVMSYGLPACLDWVEDASDWKSRKGKMGASRGLGLGCSNFISGAPKPIHWTGEPHATINLKLDFDGGITIMTGASDIGQGSSTILVQAVANQLGVEYERITLIANDSAISPKDNGSYSSRVTYMCGNAAIQAADNLKEILIQAAADKLEARPDEIECLGEVYRVANSQDEGISFNDVVAQALVDEGTITVKGTFTTPREFQGTKKFRGSAVGPSMGYSYGATVAEVSVDEATGLVTVEKLWTALDCGFAINPLSVEGQIQGQVWMGLGQAISEEAKFHNGLPLHANILDYKVPTIAESPPVDVKIVESIDPNGPFGAKEASEGALASAIAAIGNAIYDAVGVRLHEVPFSPDRVLDALFRKERDAKRNKAKEAA
jgi:4-hydroxybenzoyl-CoA reductase subunit alpha